MQTSTTKSLFIFVFAAEAAEIILLLSGCCCPTGYRTCHLPVACVGTHRTPLGKASTPGDRLPRRIERTLPGDKGLTGSIIYLLFGRRAVRNLANPGTSPTDDALVGAEWRLPGCIGVGILFPVGGLYSGITAHSSSIFFIFFVLHIQAHVIGLDEIFSEYYEWQGLIILLRVSAAPVPPASAHLQSLYRL